MKEAAGADRNWDAVRTAPQNERPCSCRAIRDEEDEQEHDDRDVEEPTGNAGWFRAARRVNLRSRIREPKSLQHDGFSSFHTENGGTDKNAAEGAP